MKITAEIGANHKGDFELAKKMIKTAANYCGVDIIKFQKRFPKELLTENEYSSPHPDIKNSYGETYGEHRENLEFDIKQHAELKKLCENEGVIYSCSVWDLTSAKEIVKLNPEIIKIPSAVNCNFPVLKYICENFKGNIHISLGMTTASEEKRIISFLEGYDRLKDTVLYACISCYPVNPKDVCLLEISRIKNAYGEKIKAIGYSGHHLNTNVDLFIQNSCIEYLERHFTFDKSWKGTDHIASLEPHEFYELKENLLKIKQACKMKPVDVLECEMEQRRKLKKVIEL